MSEELKRIVEDVAGNPLFQKLAATVLTIGGLTQVFNLITAILGAVVAFTIIGRNRAAKRKDNAMAASIERQEAEKEERKKDGLPLRRNTDDE